MKKITGILTIILFLNIKFGIALYCQVNASPPIVFIDRDSKTATFTVKNPSESPKDVEIAFKFGYPKYDSTGLYYMKFDDSTFAEKNSLNQYINAFPKKFTIEGNAEQTVRLLLKNSNKLTEDGTYFTRVSIKAKNQKAQIDTTNKDKITAGIELVMEMLNIVFYEKGELTSNLHIKTLTAQTDSVYLNLFADIEKTGNSPYIGVAIIALYNSNGDLTDMIEQRLPVYTDALIKFQTNKSKFIPGKYKAEITINNEREDIPPEYRVKVKPSIQSFEIEVK